MALEGVKRGIDTEIKPKLTLDHPEVIDALRKGNVQEVLKALPAGVTLQDVEEYLKHQWLVLDQALWQNNPIKAEAASVPPVTMDEILQMEGESALSAADNALITEGLSAFGRAATVGKGLAAGDGEGTGGVPGMIESHLQEFNEFMNNLQDRILEVQLTQEYQAQAGKLKAELQRMIALWKEGKVDTPILLAALAKFNVSKYGIASAQLGRRMMHVSDEQSRIAREIGKVGADPSAFGDLEVKRQQIGEKAMALQQLTSSMQQITQQIESLTSTVKGMIDSIQGTKRDIIRHIGAGAS